MIVPAAIQLQPISRQLPVISRLNFRPVNIKYPCEVYDRCDNECVHKLQKMQYSTDGTTFFDLATIDMTGKIVRNGSLVMPCCL